MVCKFGRRAFLSSMVAGGWAARFAAATQAEDDVQTTQPTDAAPTAKPTHVGPTTRPAGVKAGPGEIVTLGKTGIKVSRLGMGTGMRGWNGVSNQTRLGMDGFEKLFRHIHDQGVIYVDLADMYGSHRYLRHAMKGIPRDKLTILTKTVSREADGVRKDLERFRKEIGTDYIDIVLLHCLVKPDWDTRYRGPMDVLSEAKDKGWIRAHGCSCHKLAALKRAAANPWVDVDLARINPFGVKMDGKPEQVVPVLKQLHDRGAGVLGMKIIGEGAFQDAERREKSLHFITHLPHVDAFCIGFEKPTEVDDIVKRWKTVVG